MLCGSQHVEKSVEEEVDHVVYIKQESFDCTETSSKVRDGNPCLTIVKEEQWSWDEERDPELSLASENAEVSCGSERRENAKACYSNERRDNISITKSEPSWREGEVGGSKVKVELTGGERGQGDVPILEDVKHADVIKQEPIDPEFVNVGVVVAEPQDNEAATVMGVDPLAGDGRWHVTCHGEQTLENDEQGALHIASQPAEPAGSSSTLQPNTTMCQMCKKTFPTDDLINHKCMNELLFKCSTCDETFSNTKELYAHMIYDCGHEGPHKCLTCNKTFMLQRALTSHVKEYGHQDPFECTLCDRTFLHKQGLTRHILKHLSGRVDENKCLTCNKTVQQRQFKSHIEQCGRQEPYECPLCKRKFIQRQGLRIHTIHCCGIEEPYNCSRCNKTFNKMEDLTAHTRLGYCPSRPLECSTCKKSFGRWVDLNSHTRLGCGPSGPLEYSACKKMFNKRVDLLSHVRYDCGPSGPLECLACKKMFNKRVDLLSHIRYDCGPSGPVECSACKKMFNKRVDLLSHIRYGCGLTEPLECLACKKTFKEIARLNYHMKHDDCGRTGLHQCPRCKKTFLNASGVKTHLRFLRCPRKVLQHEAELRLAKVGMLE